MSDARYNILLITKIVKEEFLPLNYKLKIINDISWKYIKLYNRDKSIRKTIRAVREEPEYPPISKYIWEKEKETHIMKVRKKSFQYFNII